MKINNIALRHKLHKLINQNNLKKMNLIKRLFNKKRYFVVFYIATTDKGFQASGNCSVESDVYMNQKDITNQIESMNNFKSLVITNFIELSKKEFDIFYTI